MTNISYVQHPSTSLHGQIKNEVLRKITKVTDVPNSTSQNWKQTNNMNFEIVISSWSSMYCHSGFWKQKIVVKNAVVLAEPITVTRRR